MGARKQIVLRVAGESNKVIRAAVKAASKKAGEPISINAWCEQVLYKAASKAKAKS